jgi:putative transposase
MIAETQAFIEAEKQADRNVAKACELLVVSRSAFYDRLDHTPSVREASDAELTGKIKAIHAQSGGTYGAPRILDELREQGFHVSKKRVARLMIQAGLAGRCRRRSRRTTFADPEARALNLLARNFGPENLTLDTTWAGDVTYVRTWEGWAYLATLIDLASRRVVGWAMADHMEASLVCDAMKTALAARRPAPGLLFHSDRGSQGNIRRLTFGPCWPSTTSSRACRGGLNVGTTR